MGADLGVNSPARAIPIIVPGSDSCSTRAVVASAAAERESHSALIAWVAATMTVARCIACLSAIGVSLAALQESPDQVRDQVGLLVESEVARVKDVHLGVWHVPLVRIGLRHLE
jgi:5-enolpyruvylshikimate-3-phosphate synthase